MCSQRRPSEFTLETRNQSTVISSPRPCEHGMEQVFKEILSKFTSLVIRPILSGKIKTRYQFTTVRKANLSRQYVKHKQDVWPRASAWAILQEQITLKDFRAVPSGENLWPSGIRALSIHKKKPWNQAILTTDFFLLICKIFSEVSDLQEKAKKEGILKNEVEEGPRMKSDENFTVGN